MNAWILLATVVTAVAFGAGMVLYKQTEFGFFDDTFSVNEPPGLDSKTASNGQSVFSFYKKPIALPELKFLNSKKREVTLEAFQGWGVLLNIWATWCVPCREEMPALDRLQAELGGPDFEVIALSIDRGSSTIIERFYQDLELNSLAIYHDPTGSASYTLKVPGIPATFLINREGKAIGYVIGPIEWDSPEVVNEIKGYLSQDKKENTL
jgi:thiol-disulfide isomerase/thioredoxin